MVGFKAEKWNDLTFFQHDFGCQNYTGPKAEIETLLESYWVTWAETVEIWTTGMTAEMVKSCIWIYFDSRVNRVF